jgi:hypothetical protein
MSKGKTLSIKETKELIEADISTWLEDPSASKAVLFIMGETGNGKTELVHQVGDKLKMDMIELNLGNALDPTEITGCRIPVADKDGNYTLKLALLDDIKHHIDTNKPFILFIDELGAEQVQMRNFLLKLFSERNLNGVKLEKAYIICAGNPPGANYKTTQLEPALRARVSILYTDAKASEVADYFIEKGVKLKKTKPKMDEAYEIVANYISAFPKQFGGNDGGAEDTESPARCARAYEFATTAIYTYSLKNDRPEYLKKVLIGILGDNTGRDLAKFVKEGARGFFTPDQILSGTFKDPKDNTKWHEALENTFRHLSNTGLKPSKEMYDNIIRFIKYGKEDHINGIVRQIEANTWKLTEKVITKLETYMELEGLGSTAERENLVSPVAAKRKPMRTKTPI